jgi:hypothetical protein
MTGSVIGGIGSSTAAAPTPGTTSITDGSEAGGSCISGTCGRPDGISTAPPPPPPPPGAGRPTPLLVVDVVVSLDVVVVLLLDVVSSVVVSLDVVRSVVVGGVVVGGVVFVVDDFVVELVDEGLGGVDGGLLPPQPCAFPLLPSLPQLPLPGFSPLPGLSSAVCGSFSVPAFEPPLPSGSPLGPLPWTSLECEPGG